MKILFLILLLTSSSCSLKANKFDYKKLYGIKYRELDGYPVGYIESPDKGKTFDLYDKYQGKRVHTVEIKQKSNTCLFFDVNNNPRFIYGKREKNFNYVFDFKRKNTFSVPTYGRKCPYDPKIFLTIFEIKDNY